MRALGAPARLRILFLLLDGEKTVDELADLAAIEQSAASHHLRLLRDVRLVRVRREGRHAHYSLFDHHVPDLLASVRDHQEHVQVPEPRQTSTRPAATARR